MNPTTIRLAVVAAALALAACSGGARHPRGLPTPPVGVPATQAEINQAFDLLMAGREDDARKLVDRLLKRDPQSAYAQLLSDSIRRDPKDLLGPTSYPYTAHVGETVVTLAQRLLGNRLKAYQLLRYNGLKAPATLTAGQVLRIPGEPPRIEPVRRPEPSAPVPAPRPATVPTPRPKPAAPKPVTPAANPAAARAARAAGLAALNGGDINRAVALLRRAATLDPGNPAIARDAARAERIAATVRARK